MWASSMIVSSAMTQTETLVRRPSIAHACDCYWKMRPEVWQLLQASMMPSKMMWAQRCPRTAVVHETPSHAQTPLKAGCILYFVVGAPYSALVNDP
mmetsp:Transcript_150495/g.265610  ORF Transcript_150495/g.265610 Transcript_150495/m.265610 type:complete len:96 (+) Transcript_150495:498-785(+)